ncbi:hypothetical protein PYCCODRAFT_21294 [Trametes coccinea BRFM310]|uniref:F-box domain-containing protein n=1 Tax=Trametes coccinea (strain BRFM310) TaxID=1353009 RepID=A0A1Y2J4V0_TRAC3|nr:hypothetical protein PYCCODRAFT_21294 [Trametes coccinea BRFM310]
MSLISSLTRCASSYPSKQCLPDVTVSNTDLQAIALSAFPHPLICSFQDLDDDVLHHIVMELVSMGLSGTQWLKSLSLTCRCVRESCMPVLFQRCYGWTFSHGEIPPETIRPYVR